MSAQFPRYFNAASALHKLEWNRHGQEKRTGAVIPLERITHSIILIRGQKVMLDMDLARLYGVETKTLNRAIRRNIDRFPEDFMFQLTTREYADLRRHLGSSNLRYQIGTSS